MNDMKNTFVTMSAVWVVVTAVALFFAVTRVDQYLKIKAVDDCARISRYEVQEKTGAKVSMPIEDQYKNCVKAKGY